LSFTIHLATMRHFTLLLALVLSALTTLTAQTPPVTCYNRIADQTGLTPAPQQLQELEAAACVLIDSFPAAYQDSFAVFDFGFYLHNGATTGGYPEAFQQAIAKVQAVKPYYLLFGRQSTEEGVNKKFWVELKLPSGGEFVCLKQSRIAIIV
jgi:hypothetical protein